jgi:hypothetical protein
VDTGVGRVVYTSAIGVQDGKGFLADHTVTCRRPSSARPRSCTTWRRACFAAPSGDLEKLIGRRPTGLCAAVETALRGCPRQASARSSCGSPGRWVPNDHSKPSGSSTRQR